MAPPNVVSWGVVYIYIYVCICMCIHTHIYMYIFILYIHIYPFVYTYPCVSSRPLGPHKGFKVQIRAHTSHASVAMSSKVS